MARRPAKTIFFENLFLVCRSPDSFGPCPDFLSKGFMWVGVATSFAALAFRLVIRVKTFRRLWWDDLLALCAWGSFVASSAVWQTQHDGVYDPDASASGAWFPTPDFLRTSEATYNAQTTVVRLYCTCNLAFNYSLLAFSLRCVPIARVKKVWWCMMAAPLATYAACIYIIQHPCLLRDATDVESELVVLSKLPALIVRSILQGFERI